SWKRLFSSAVVLCSLFFSVSAFSQTSLSGEVRGVEGRLIRGAEVRLQREDAKAAPVALKTNAKGHFSAGKLPAGRYAVTASAGGLASAPQSVKVSSARAETLPLRLVAAASANAGPVKKKKHLVWVPAQTGSRIGGGYVEVDDAADNSPKKDSADLQRLQNTQATLMSRAPSGGGR
ncbi:MAG: carboxypeptidase-like regulatory domain-containing protein, partial [Chthoniobacterales bacterium]